MKLRYYIPLLFLSFVFFFKVNAQEPPVQTFQLKVEGHITNLEDTPMPGVVVQVMSGSKVITQATTDGTGKYGFELPLNSDYTINVMKPGYATKKYVISTRGVPPERAASKFSTIEASLSMFEKIDGVDYSVLNQPLNKYFYDQTKENFLYDKAYLDQMIGSLQNLLAAQDAAINKKKQEEANYQAAIKAGDKAFQKKDWASAKAQYGQASTLRPAENYPKDQMAQIDKIIADQEALNKKNADEAKKATEEAAKKKAEEDLNNKYIAALKKGDDAFAKRDWTTAKAGYNEALGLKPAEQLPKDKLALVDKAIADAAKADADAKSKAELEAKYADAIKKGDAGFGAKDWANAKAAYTEASGLKPAEQYPKDRIAAIDKVIADDVAAKAKADADAKNKAELEAKYAAAVKKGDDAFGKKDWTTAKAGYNEALGIKAAEKYPKDQLAAVDKAIADEAAAKAKADADAKSKAELDAKYTAAVKKGDDAFAANDWATAKAGYTDA
ncbi:MAG: carboxypeptidase-like regulatory domain-containing protein, partial [Bacteroidia bacterium]